METTLIPFIPSNLGPLLQIDLLILEQARKKNAAQHRSALFFRRVHEIYRLGREVYRELEWMGVWMVEERERRKEEGFRRKHEMQEEATHREVQQNAEGEARKHIVRLTMLLERIFPALTKASDSVTKMVHHLHFLPLTTLLQAAYARIWVLSCTILAHVRPRKGEEPDSTGMEAVLSGEEVISLGSIHGSATDMGTMTGRGRMDIAKAELETRAGDLSRTVDKGKGRGKVRVEGEMNGAGPDSGEGQVGGGLDEDLSVDFGTKVERSSTPIRPGLQSRSSSKSISNLMPQSGVKAAAETGASRSGQNSLSSEVEERTREGSSPVARAIPASLTAVAPSARAGPASGSPSRGSTPTKNKGDIRAPAPTVGTSYKPTKVDKRTPTSSSTSMTKGVDVTEIGGETATKKKEKKKRTTDIDDLFGGLVPSGKEAGTKRRKVDDRTALGDAEVVAPVAPTVVEKPEAVSTPAEGSKSKLKRAPDTGKVKLKKKKKKGDDLDDIFGF